MRTVEPFQQDDLAELDMRLLDRAARVVAMEDVAQGDTEPGVIGLRHDVDNVIEPAVAMAEWEAERGYRSTYFILHTAPYWDNKTLLQDSLAAISEQGHEIGIHCNALAEACETGRDPADILHQAIDELRSYGYPVTGVVAHGDRLCHTVGFVNDEMFLESRRSSRGEPTRELGGVHTVKLAPVSRERFGLEYDASWLPRADYLSDSGGRWSQPFSEVAERFPTLKGQLHMLVHADWWPQAFPHLAATA